MLAALKPEFWWFVARASGLVAWVLLSLAVLWGLLVASRMIPLRTAPKWLLDTHRFLGALTVVFTVRGSLLRVISVRPMSRRERRGYGQANDS